MLIFFLENNFSVSKTAQSFTCIIAKDEGFMSGGNFRNILDRH